MKKLGAPATEDEFTQPNAECPDPRYWHAWDGESAEIEVSEFVGALVRMLQPDYVIETGSAFGHTSRTIGLALAQNGHGRLDSIELDRLRVLISRAQVVDLPVSIVEAHSMGFVPPQPIDFAWFDSEVSTRIYEFNRFYKWMHKRTVVAFHDTGEQHQPLRSQIEEMAVQLRLAPVFLPTPRGICVARVLTDKVVG